MKFCMLFRWLLKGMMVSVRKLVLGNGFGNIPKAIVAFACFS
jgi:hypothetical protein